MDIWDLQKGSFLQILHFIYTTTTDIQLSTYVTTLGSLQTLHFIYMKTTHVQLSTYVTTWVLPVCHPQTIKQQKGSKKVRSHKVVSKSMLLFCSLLCLHIINCVGLPIAKN